MPEGATVLLAERDLVSTQLLLFILKRAGFQVVTATGGAHLLHLVRRHHVDLILSEVLLPDGDGMDICRQVRASWSARHIPIVLLASHADPEYRVRGLLAGADDYVSKPFDLNELMIRLNHLIEVYSTCSQVDPVTRLPGRQVTRAFVSATCLEEPATSWAFLCLDLVHFRSYNELYGYTAGDRVLGMVAELLREVVFVGEDEPRFVGHLGGDRFAAVLPLADVAATCPTLVAEFDERIAEYYPPDQRDNPSETIIDRRGNLYRVPRLGLAIGVVTADLCEHVSYLELEDTALAVLKRAKVEGVSAYYVNQRKVSARPY